LDGVFKSWAVTKGLSLDPHDKRLAVQVEDHPLDYGDFDGTIPAGEYGGGTVQLWDRGYWQPDGSETPQQSLANGGLRFTLEGERLRGNWVLVRMKPVRTERKRVNWLLIKRRDEHSRDAEGSAVLVEDRSIASGRTMAAIADGKGRGPKPFILAGQASADPGAVWDSGTSVPAAKPAVTKSAAGSNRARPKRASVKSSLKLPDFIPPQLCVNMERPPNGPGWAHEIKFDGYRVQLRVQDGTVTLKTRKGLDWTAKFGTIADAASRLSNGIIDGEIVALGAHDMGLSMSS